MPVLQKVRQAADQEVNGCNVFHPHNLLMGIFGLRKSSERQDQLSDAVEARTRELALAKERAEDANRLNSRFLANISHEIRTPMNTVLGSLELALMTELNREQREYL